MERVKLIYQDLTKAFATLAQILEEPFSVIVRDATIQRFEYTFEVLWKFIKEYLKENEGIMANSPKSCFREIFSLGYLTEQETETLEEMGKRFVDMQKYMDKRFEEQNQRITELREDMNKRFNMKFAFITIGYTVITGLIVLFKFLK